MGVNKKVLIVDDNKNNRMILSLLMEDYLDENEGVSLDITEVENGQEAVDACIKTPYDLVFMDIMMPVMDGISATKIIRQNNKNIMIIAVSAVDDSERQKMILSNGAEDYISKPVNADIFNSRFSNYLALLNSRHRKRESEVTTNLFTRDIYSRQLVFAATSDDALAEFWEYYLLDEHVNFDNLSDLVRAVFDLASLVLKLGSSCQIIVEESQNSLYFTLSNLEVLDERLIKLSMAKNSVIKSYKIANDKMSFELPKLDTRDVESITPVVEVASVVTAVETPVVAKTAEYMKSSQEMHVYHYMDHDDLDELENYANKLSSLLLMVGNSSLEDDEITDIYTLLDHMAKTLTIYSESYIIGQALQNLSHDINAYLAEFKAQSTALGPMCTAFSNDMITWIEMTFHKGAPSVDFMNDTIVVNTQTISSMLKMDDTSNDAGVDDIFDF